MFLPPGPTASTALQTWRWVHDPTGFMRRERERHGDIFTIRLATSGNVVLISRPDVIRQVFTLPAEDARAGEVAALLRPFVGEGSLLLLDGVPHLRHRKMLLPPFHGQRMRLYTTVMQSVAAQCFAEVPTDEPVTLRPVMQRITLHIILKTVFGLQETADLHALEHELLRLLHTADGPLSSLLLVPAFQIDAPLSPWRRFMAKRHRVDQLIYSLIAQRRDQPPETGEDVLSLMLQARDEAGHALTDEEVRDELMTLVLAGHETTATALCWTVQCLLETPSAHTRLRKELDAAALPDDLSDALPGLTYLDAVIKEALRLRPVVPIVGRKLHAAVELPGGVVAPGTVLAPCIYLTHRDGNIYPEPDAFKPERFVSFKPDAYTFFPFGGGSRRCLGMAFALHEMRVVLATLLRRFDVVATTHRPERTVRRAVTLAPRSGTRVRLMRRA